MLEVRNLLVFFVLAVLGYRTLCSENKDCTLLFSVELLETGGIYISSYWKIAGLAACYFQGNSWKLGVSIIQVIGK